MPVFIHAIDMLLMILVMKIRDIDPSIPVFSSTNSHI